MRPKMFPLLAVVALFGAIFISNSCGSSPASCPVCGTDKHATVGLIDVMLVPEHNGTGEPGGPFNIFDISWVDPVNRFYYVSDRVGLDVPMFSTVTNIAVAALGGDNSIAEAGDNASTCIDSAKTPTDLTIIPPITTAQGNYTRFGCKTMGFALPGFFGANGHFGGFIGGQCCASRSNNLNPLTGPNGLEASPDGNFLYVGNGSSNVVVFDMTQTISSNGAVFPRVVATLVSGTSPDYDGPLGIGPCQASANGRAFSDPTCGDLRGDELATTGATPAVDPTGNKHDLLMVINGDPGLPFTTIFDITNVIGHGTGTLSQQQLHCLPVNPNAPYSPGGPMSSFPANYASCILGQIYYDGAPAQENNFVIDDGNNGATDPNAGFPCPDPSLQFAGTPGNPGLAVPSGASGHGVGVAGADVPCHRSALVPTGGTEVALAGLGGMVFNPNTGHFLLTNGNASAGDITYGTVDEIDPFFIPSTGPVAGFPNGWPAVINSFPVPNCMPSGIAMGPGTDALVTCAGHDGRQFAPLTYIINGTTGAIISTINFVGGVDQGWYNPGDNKYYEAARDMLPSPVLGVIDAGSRQWLQNVPTSGNAHSVAADPKNNHVFVPLPAGGLCQSQAPDGCVGVYASQ
jgi:hypothetical protein